MFIAVEDLTQEPLELRHVYPAGELKLGHEGASLEGTVKLEMRLAHAGPELEVSGFLQTGVKCVCSRCLKEFGGPLERGFQLSYRPHPKPAASDEEIELKYDEMEIGFYDGVRFDVDLMVLEQIELSLPMKLVCREDCRGLCPKCGADQNEASCGCPPEPRDARLASLLEFRKKIEP